MPTDRGKLEDELRRWCAANAQHVTADSSVYESTAALLLDRSPGTLANQRANGAGVRYYRVGRTGRVRYRLADIAAALEKSPHD